VDGATTRPNPRPFLFRVDVDASVQILPPFRMCTSGPIRDNAKYNSAIYK
jgi:hypothetical protein